MSRFIRLRFLHPYLKKRQAVKIAPGQRFVRIADIRRAKRRLRSRVMYNDKVSDVDMPGKGTAPPEGCEKDLTEPEKCIDIPNSGRKDQKCNRNQ